MHSVLLLNVPCGEREMSFCDISRENIGKQRFIFAECCNAVRFLFGLKV